MVNSCQWSADKEPYGHIPVGPRRISLEFLIATGAQIRVLNRQQADELGIKPSRKTINILGVTGVAEKRPIARTQLWLPGEKRTMAVEVALSPCKGNRLGFDVLAGRQWCLPGGRLWSFGSREAEATDVRVLQPAPALPHSKLTCIPQYPLPSAARRGITELLDDLERRQIISPAHSPYNSPVWPVRKPEGQWRLTMDYGKLNTTALALTAAVPSIASIVTAMQAAAHAWMATLDIKDMFFMVPLREEDKPQFAFTWEGTQYTFNRLPQGYKHSPTIARNALAKLLHTIKVPAGIHIYQYTDDILIGGGEREQVRQTAEAIWDLLTKNGLDVPPSKCQGPGQEIKFLGAWWIAGACSDGHLYSREVKPLQKGTWEKAKMRLGWWLEALFGMGTASVKNRQAIRDLTAQVSVFANSTSDSLELLHEQ